MTQQSWTWRFQSTHPRGVRLDFDPTGVAIKKDSDMYKALDVKILGIFSDWPATVTYYANCMNLK